MVNVFESLHCDPVGFEPIITYCTPDIPKLKFTMEVRLLEQYTYQVIIGWGNFDPLIQYLFL